MERVAFLGKDAVNAKLELDLFEECRDVISMQIDGSLGFYVLSILSAAVIFLSHSCYMISYANANKGIRRLPQLGRFLF